MSRPSVVYCKNDKTPDVVLCVREKSSSLKPTTTTSKAIIPPEFPPPFSSRLPTPRRGLYTKTNNAHGSPVTGNWCPRRPAVKSCYSGPVPLASLKLN